MIGLSFLVAGLIYLLITYLVTMLAVKLARRRGVAGWKWGLPILIIMYLLVAWDQIPTLVKHKYYCMKHAEFIVYKTLENWEIDNQMGLEKLDIDLQPSPAKENGLLKYWTTQRFYTVVDRGKEVSRAIRIERKSFYDADTDEIMAQSVNFWRGESGGVIAMGGSLSEIRRYIVLGLGNRQCGKAMASPTELMDKYRYSFQLLGENK